MELTVFHRINKRRLPRYRKRVTLAQLRVKEKEVRAKLYGMRTKRVQD